MTDPRKIIEKIQKRNEFLKFVKEQVPALQDSPEDISIHIFLLSWIAGEIKDIPHGKAFIEREVLDNLNGIIGSFENGKVLPASSSGIRKDKISKRVSVSQGGIYRKRKGDKGDFAYHIYRENGRRREKYLGVFNEISRGHAEIYKATPSVSVQIINSTRYIYELYFMSTKRKKKFLGHTTVKKSDKRG